MFLLTIAPTRSGLQWQGVLEGSKVDRAALIAGPSAALRRSSLAESSQPLRPAGSADAFRHEGSSPHSFPFAITVCEARLPG
jgi:hypothetical protein